MNTEIVRADKERYSSETKKLNSMEMTMEMKRVSRGSCMPSRIHKLLVAGLDAALRPVSFDLTRLSSPAV